MIYKPYKVYVVVAERPHGTEIYSEHRGYYSLERAEKKVKEYHKKGMKWMKVWTIRMQDKREED